MKQFLLFAALFFAFSSCIKNNPDPAWIQINKWTLEPNILSANDPGVLTESITNGWVYVDGELIGVFELPCTIPVLQTGSKTIQVYPTILNNGISATKKIYPFMEVYEVTANLVANETVTLNPVTRYKASAEFWIEDFELASNNIETDPNSLTVHTTSSDPLIIQPLNGNQFCRITLDATNNTWVGYSTGASSLMLDQGQEVYLEIDYHNSNRITTGLLAVSSSGTQDNPNIQLNPQDDGEIEWKKIYIDLREIISGSASDAQFQLSFQALIDDGESTGEINIDNIKVVHF